MHAWRVKLSLALAASGVISAGLVEQVRAADSGHDSTYSADFERGWEVTDRADGQNADIRRSSGGGVPESAPRSRRVDGAFLGPVALQYEGGERRQREARLVADPENPANQVLEFSLREPNVVVQARTGVKGRVQMNMYGNRGAYEVFESVRMRLSDGFEPLVQAPAKFNWLTISEWWNNAGWTREPFPFRISVNLVKTGGTGDALHLSVHASTQRAQSTDNWDTTVWHAENLQFDVPLRRWLVLNYYFRDGGEGAGRFVMTATPQGGKRVVIADISATTRHPDARASDGLAHLNPVKLYTSRDLVERVRRVAPGLTVHWDDLQVQACDAAASRDAPSACTRALAQMID